MKILILYNKVPLLNNDGGSMVVMNEIEAIRKSGHYVYLCCFNTSKHWISETDINKNKYQIDGFLSISLDNKIKWFSYLYALCVNKNYNLSRYFSKSIKDKLIDYIQSNKFESVIFHGLEMLQYQPYIKKKLPKINTYYRAHNIEHKIWHDLMQQNQGIKKYLFFRSYLWLKNIEYNLPKSLNGIIALGSIDFNFFTTQTTTPIINFIGFKNITHNSSNNSNYINAYHVGTMDWQPNIEAMKWFCENVLNKLTNKNFVFHIAGKNMPEFFYNLSKQYKNLKVESYVFDINSWTNDKDILIVPLQSGSGIRVKIIEAFSLGKVVIASTVAMQGLDAKANKDYLHADTIEEYLQHIDNICNGVISIEALKLNAKQFFENKFDIDKNIKHFLKFIEENNA